MSKIEDDSDIVSVEDLIAVGVVSFYDSMLEECMSKPDTLEANMKMMSAFAIALRTAAERRKESQALLDHLKAQL